MCLSWWGSPDLKTAVLQLFDFLFPVGILLLLFLDLERSVHAAEMLGEEVLAVELVATILVSVTGA